jgi:subtilase family serine protease
MDDVGVRITSFSILNKAEVKRGAAGEIELQFEIKNNMDIIWGSNGPIDMNEVSVNWKAYIEGTDVASTGTELLVGGGTKTITTKLTSQNRIVRIRVLADYTNSIKETNENNNEAVIDIVTG